ncbi:HrpJ domain-containing protein [Pseudomonas carassii]|uniref:HrpJ domain-containing protein n=1 Tax=Pseudomonas carassii TaxID=3115855 RepID=A0ABU7H9F8_9PSED|nr:HrpJ domain-containing protein [Pseudomonas sp. 137P]MEE1887841.1 HrpJ domain-containing protein [Pseudomonas sp. 137P]
MSEVIGFARVDPRVAMEGGWETQATLQARQVTPMGQQAEMAEEVSMAFSSLANARLSTRSRVTDARQHGLQTGQAAEEMLAKVPDVQRRALEELVAWLRQHPSLTSGELEARLDGFSGEVCHRYLALAYARDALGKTADGSGALDTLDQVMASMAQTQGQAIALGIEIGPLAQATQAQGVAEVAALREVYRDFLCGYRGLRHAWDDLRTRFGDAAIGDIAQFMLNGLASHISGPSSYLDSNQLQQVISDMKLVQALKKLEGDTVALFRQLAGEPSGVRAF